MAITQLLRGSKGVSERARCPEKPDQKSIFSEIAPKTLHHQISCIGAGIVQV